MQHFVFRKGEPMRVRTILTLCSFLVLLFAGAALFAEPAPAPAPAAPFLDSGAQPAAAPMCPAPAPAAKPDLGGPVANTACPANVWQQCFQRYGTCTLCYCIGGSCYCENRCV
jgi:hypothetical protein